MSIFDFGITQNIDLFIKLGSTYTWLNSKFDGKNAGWLCSAEANEISVKHFRPKAELGFGYKISKNIIFDVAYNFEFSPTWSSALLMGFRYHC